MSAFNLKINIVNFPTISLFYGENFCFVEINKRLVLQSNSDIRDSDIRDFRL